MNKHNYIRHDHFMRVLRERDAWIDTAKNYADGMDYYKSLLDNIAEHFGVEAYVADDGSVSDSPLRAKLPDLTSKMLAQNTIFRKFFVRRLDLALSKLQTFIDAANQ